MSRAVLQFKTTVGFCFGVLALLILCFSGCKKPQPAKLDPHSADAVLITLVQQGNLLNDATARSDFKYVHDYTYYFNGLAQSLASKLNDQQKERLGGFFDQLKSLTDQLDHASGRKHAEATQASMNQLLTTLKELEKQYHQLKNNAKS
jgi:hypothetical protein